MKFTLHVDSNECAYVLAHDAVICDRLQTALALLLQQLHADDLKRTTFIGHGLDPVAAVESATKAQRAKEDHERIFAQPPEEIAAKKEIEAGIKAAQKELRY
jgi:hypothetical protein